MTPLPSVGIFHNLPSVASMLCCSEMNRDFQSEQKTQCNCDEEFWQLCQQLAEQRYGTNTKHLSAVFNRIIRKTESDGCNIFNCESCDVLLNSQLLIVKSNIEFST